MQEAQVSLAVAKYRSVKEAKRRADRIETELHQQVAELDPDSFALYATLTTQIDDRDNARDAARHERSTR